MVEIWPKTFQQTTAFLGDQLVTSLVATQIVKIKQANFAFYKSKSELKRLRNQKYYSQPLHFWGTSLGLARYLVDLAWLNKASIPNFSHLGSLEMVQIYLPRWVLGVRLYPGKTKTNFAFLIIQIRLEMVHYSQPHHFWETSWWLARQLLRLY